MENKSKKQQSNFSPFLPNSAQIRELRMTGGAERAWEYLAKIMDATLARYHFEKLATPWERLRAVMKTQGLSLSKLSNLSGISENSLSGYCMGKRMPKQSNRERIASALGMTPEEIWGDGFPNTGRDN